MYALVVGGAGFIGSHLTDALLGEGHQVAVLDDLSSGSRENLAPQAEFYCGNVCCKEDVDAVFAAHPVDIVFYTAACRQQHSWQPEAEAACNIMGLLHVLEQCRIQAVRRIVYSSSAAVYGEGRDGSFRETAPLLPASPEGVSKMAAEQYLRLYHDRWGIETIILRYASVYGERQNLSGGGVVGLFSQALADGRELTIYGDGNQSRDFVYVKDAAAANLAAMAPDVPSGIYNISTNIETTINALKEILMYFSGFRTAVAYEENRPGELYRLVLNNEKALQTLHWRPKTKLLPGLMAAYSYFLRREHA